LFSLFRYLPNGLFGIAWFVMALFPAGLAGGITGYKGVGVIVLGLAMTTELAIRCAWNQLRRRRNREPLWFIHPGTGGHYGWIPTWCWGGIVVVLGVLTTFDEIKSKREQAVNEANYKRYREEKAKEEAAKPPKKTGFELTIRNINGWDHFVMTNHNDYPLYDVDLEVTQQIGGKKENWGIRTIASWSPGKEETDWLRGPPGALYEAVDVEGSARIDDKNHRIPVKISWRRADPPR
jgi:hypothetical protein